MAIATEENLETEKTKETEPPPKKKASKKSKFLRKKEEKKEESDPETDIKDKVTTMGQDNYLLKQQEKVFSHYNRYLESKNKIKYVHT